MKKFAKSFTKTVVPLIIVFAFFGICIYSASQNLKAIEFNDNNVSYNKSDQLAVHYIDVGQGDSEFIELPNGECMLIDASYDSQANTVINTISSLGYSKIDYVVATHPHSDHIGALDEVVEYFDVGSFYMPNVDSSSKCYDDLQYQINNKGIDVTYAETGVQIYNDNKLHAEFLSPISKTYSDTNNYSAVVKITYGNNSFLFMGDGEALLEEELVDKYSYYIDSDVLKVGHHGSTYSSCNDFLSVVTPRYAVISCGKDNPYDHPNEDAVERLENCGADIYCTDECSTITVTCDGNDNFDITTLKNN